VKITCPFCGGRDVEEFQFRSVIAEAQSTAFERVYERVNDASNSLEYWQHALGCRVWLVIRRNPSTGEIGDVRVLGAT
jgi:methylglutamate dehydrogenase subunit B